MAGMSIGKAAELSGCTVATIRHYEGAGLLKGIDRAPNGRRVYRWPDVHQLRFIRRCRDLGFGVEEVRTLLGATNEASPDCLSVRDLAVTHIQRLKTMRGEIDALERTLSTLAATCNAACASGRSPVCTIIEDLGATVSR